MRIGTRGSALALAQARLVAQWLGGGEGHEIIVVRVGGDSSSGAPQASGEPEAGSGALDSRARALGDKSRWVAELEQALLEEEIDLAVHSAKDVPGEPVAGLELFGAPPRADARDALIGANALEGLVPGARVGTSSVRRAAQLRAARADLEVVSVRGNVDTRLAKLARGARNAAENTHGDPAEDTGGAGEPSGASEPLDAIVLASAGLHRLGRVQEIGAVLDIERFVPAPGQGTLALQGRAEDASTRAAVEAILDKDTSACLVAERALARALNASCNTPLGAYATPEGCGCLVLRAWVGLPDGSAWVRDELMGGFYDPEELGVRVAQRLTAAGAGDLLGRAEELAVEHA